MKILYLFFFIFSLSLVAKGQVDNDFIYSGKLNLLILPGLSYQGSGNYYGELNVMLSKPISGVFSHYDQGFTFGIESKFDKKNYVIAPKVGYETALLFSFRGSIISYIENEKSDLRALFEIGTGSFKYFTISYGYNIALLNYESILVSKHRITFIYKIYRRKINTIFVNKE